MKLSLKKIYWKSALRFIFPRECLHCHESLQDVLKIFCPICQSIFDFLSSEEKEIVAVFENLGPAKSLSAQFETTLDDQLAELIVSCLLFRHHRLSLEFPDVITFIPSIDSKKNASKYLAKRFAQRYCIPCIGIFEMHVDREVYNENGLLYTMQIKKDLSIGSLGIICNTITQDALDCLKAAKTSGAKQVFLLGFC